MKPGSGNNLDAIDSLNDETVSKYLIENPEFFNRKADLLLELSIPHESGAAISLLERQVALFRERNRELQNNINDFIFNAEENDALFEKTRIVILELLKATSLAELSGTVDETLKVSCSGLYNGSAQIVSGGIANFTGAQKIGQGLPGHLAGDIKTGHINW